MLLKLQDIILNISFPKTITAKTASIPVDVLPKARTSISLACISARESPQENHIANIQSQLDFISTHLGLNLSPNNTKRTYADTVSHLVPVEANTMSTP
jgi:hypothetical protein